MIDIERMIVHARESGCFFEINSSPDRLDLSADNARHAASAGVMIAYHAELRLKVSSDGSQPIKNRLLCDCYWRPTLPSAECEKSGDEIARSSFDFSVGKRMLPLVFRSERV
jgi:hypothetical protein